MGSRLRSELGQELTLVVVMVSWAGNFIVTKAALAHVPPVVYQFVAFAVGSIALLGISQAIYRQVPPRFLLLQMALLGALGVGLNQLLFASGLAATTAGNAALLVATVPLFALLVSSAIGEEHMSWPAVGGTLLSLVGVALVMGTGLSVVAGGGHLRGDLLVLASAIMYATFVSLGSRLIRDEPPLRFTAWAFAIGTLLLMPVGAAQASAVNWRDIRLGEVLAVLYSGLVIGLGNALLMNGVRRLGPARVTRFQFLIPVLVVVLAAVFLRERVRVEQITGGILILGGVLISRRRRPANKPPDESQGPGSPIGRPNLSTVYENARLAEMADRVLRVGTHTVEPGQRVEALVSVDLGLAQVEVPVVLINGSRAGPRVGVTAGIHGAEYVPIAALRDVVSDVDPSTVTGALVAVIVANPSGFYGRSVYTNPLDGKNINRLFPGDPAGGPSDRLAAWIFREVIAPADRFIDLHCGDMNEILLPFVGYDVPLPPESKDVVLNMAAAYGLDYILEFDGSGGVSHMAISAGGQAGVPSIIAEVGGGGRWPNSDVRRHADGLRRALAAAGLLPGPQAAPTSPPTRMGRSIWMRSPATGCFHPAVELGQLVTKGQLLGEVQDFFGHTVAPVEAPFAGLFFFLVTSMSTKSGDPLLGIAAEE